MSGREMFRRLPFPFPGGRFPADLGAVVQRSVLDGDEPARDVVHSVEGSWMVGDGVHDPNEPGADIATHIWHVIDRDPAIAELAGMLPGHIAERIGPGDPWVISPHLWPED